MEKEPHKKVKPQLKIVPAAWLKLKMEKWEEWRKLENNSPALALLV
jgi:hypothetical protein